VWDCGLQIWHTTILGWSSRHLPRVTIEEMFEGICGRRVPEVTPLKAELSYPEHSIKFLDQKDRVTRHKTIKFFKIQWSHHSEEEAT
jgi:hypothetical protein